MKKRIVLLILLLFVTAAIFAGNDYAEYRYFYTTDRLKLRQGSDLSSNVLTVLDEKTFVLILEKGPAATIDDRTDNWVKVRTLPVKGDGNVPLEGWVFGGYLVEAYDFNFENDEGCDWFYIYDGWFDEKCSGSYDRVFYIVENNGYCEKLFRTEVPYCGPNFEVRCSDYRRVENGRKIIYLEFCMMDDGPGEKSIMRVDVTDYAGMDCVFTYRGATGNQSFIDQNVKTLLRDRWDWDGNITLQITPVSDFVKYRDHDFSSEKCGVLQEDESYTWAIGWSEYRLYFEDDKPGCWVMVMYPNQQSYWKWPKYWIWIE